MLAGPVHAATFFREARWVVETWKLAVLERQDSGPRLKRFFGKAHAERLRYEYGSVVPESVSPHDDPSPASLAALLERPSYQALSAPGKVHVLLVAAPLIPIEQVYQLVFEEILKERISTNPVEGAVTAD